MLPVVNDFPVEMLPIIEASPAKSLFVDSKAQRANQPKLGTEGDASATNGACIGGNFRLKKYDMQSRWHAVLRGIPGKFAGRKRHIELESPKGRLVQRAGPQPAWARTVFPSTCSIVTKHPKERESTGLIAGRASPDRQL